VATRIHPGLLGSAVVCAALTVVFAAGAAIKHGEATRLHDGDPERPTAETVPKLLEARAQLNRDIKANGRELAQRRSALLSADIELNRHGIYYSGNQRISGIITPGGDTANAREHSLAMARFALEQSGRRLEALKTEYGSPSRQTFPQLDKSISDRNAELQAVSTRISEHDAAYQKERAALTEKLEGLKTETQGALRDLASERSRRQTRITQLEDEIRKLLELDLRWLTEVEPVGRLMVVEDRSKRVIIDIGTDDRVFAGLLFEVFSWDKGFYVEKGMIEVIEVQDSIAICRILSQNDPRLHPIAREDRIGNPTFNPRRPNTFVVAGEFNRYNRSDIEQFIRRSGGVIVPQVGPGVDFLVAGERSDREQAQAREYKILGMKEEQLLKYVLPLFSPR
jgi:hypothetical protein